MFNAIEFWLNEGFSSFSCAVSQVTACCGGVCFVVLGFDWFSNWLN
jgi:hypothetical protein